MALQMQCESYMPGYTCMRDFNVEVENTWPLHQKDRSINRQFYNTFIPMHVNRYSDYETEELKQTMLSHENIFRKQVHELHRLYKIQRDLMEELKRKNQVQAPQLVLYTSHLSSKDEEMILQIPSLKSVDTKHNGKSDSAISDTRPSPNLLKCGGLNACKVPTGSHSVSQTNSEQPIFKSVRHTKVMIDLQLPADAYIDGEDIKTENENNAARTFFEPLKPCKLNGIGTGNDVKLTLATGENSHPTDCTETSSQCSSKFHIFVDLNEPTKEMSCDGKAASSSKRVGMHFSQEEIQMHHLSSLMANSACLNLQNISSRGSHKDEPTHSFNLDANKEEIMLELPLINKAIGNDCCGMNSFCPTFFDNGVVPSSKQIKFEASCELYSSSNWSNRESWFMDAQTHEISTRSGLAKTSNSGLADALMSDKLSSVSQAHDYGFPILSDPLLKRPINGIAHDPGSAQALPFFNASGSRHIQSKSEYLKSHQSFTSEHSSFTNGIFHNYRWESNAPFNFRLPNNFDKMEPSDSDYSADKNLKHHGLAVQSSDFHYMDVKSKGDTYLNLKLLNGSENILARISTEANVLSSKNQFSSGVQWITSSLNYKGTSRKMSNCTSQYCINPPLCHSEMKLTHDLASELPDRSTHSERLCFQDVLQSSSQKKEFSDIPTSELIHDTPAIDRQHLTTGLPSTSQLDLSTTNYIKKNDKDSLAYSSRTTECLNSDRKISKEPVTEDSIERGIGYKDRINLNSIEATVHQSISSEEHFHLPHPHSTSCKRITCVIDLEVPASFDEEDPLLLGKESLTTNSLTLSSEMPEHKLVERWEIENVATLRMAANTIVAISSEVCSPSNHTSFHSLVGASLDSLQWFADIVASNAHEPLAASHEFRSETTSHGGSDIHNGMDFFESMTLKLTETKVDDYSHPPNGGHERINETGLPSLLLTKSRKDQARRRRQKRDFQKEFLPGLASLSRNEVTEDLQTIGGLMKASGQNWQTSTTRRNSSRNRGNCQGRGRRRPRAATTEAVEIPVDQRLRQRNDNDFQFEGINIIGWGRTRRCRRQGCPSGNIVSSLT